MEKNEKRELTQAEYLAAYALFHMAREQMKKCDAFEEELCKLLGLEKGVTNISDAIYGGDHTFDAATFNSAIGLTPWAEAQKIALESAARTIRALIADPKLGERVANG